MFQLIEKIKLYQQYSINVLFGFPVNNNHYHFMFINLNISVPKSSDIEI